MAKKKNNSESNVLVATLVFAVSMFIILSCSVLAETSTLTANEISGTEQAGIIFSNNTINEPENSDLYYIGYFEQQDLLPMKLWTDNGFGGVVDITKENFALPCSELDENLYEQQSSNAIVDHQYCILSRDLTNYIHLTITNTTLDYSSIIIEWGVEEQVRELSEEERSLMEENLDDYTEDEEGETEEDTNEETTDNETVENFETETVEFPENKSQNGEESEILDTVEDNSNQESNEENLIESEDKNNINNETNSENTLKNFWLYYVVIIILLALITLILYKLIHHER